MKNPLIPTPIVNKNGVATTVYKRDTISTVNAAELPAPNLNKQATVTFRLSPEKRTEMVDDLVSRFTLSSNPFGFNDESDQAFRDQLEEYSDELIDKLHASAQRTDGGNGAFLLAKENKSEEYLHTYLALRGDQYERIFVEGRGYSFNLPDAMDSLEAYPQLSYEHTPEYYQKAAALTGVVATIQHKIPYEDHWYKDQWRDDKDARFIRYAPNPNSSENDRLARVNNDDLVDLILERPDRWEQIADIIVSRSTDDADLIRSILNSDASSISEGLL